MTDILSEALALHRAGYATIRASTDGQKRPLGKWDAYQNDRPDEQQITAWFADGHHGIGIVCGKVSGNAEMLEFEGRAVAEGVLAEWAEIMDASGLADLRERLRGWVEQSPAGGYHIHYRVDGPVPGNTKLARRPATAAELRESAEKVKVLIETRGEGGFVVTAPSNGTTHPSGKPWVRISGGPETAPTLTLEEHRALYTACRILDQMPTPEQPTRASVPAEASGGRPGDVYNDKTDWAEILTGWTLVYVHGGVRYWRRPGKNIGVSATTGRNDGDNLYVFSTSTEFDSERPYSKFAAYTLLEHRGDYSAAAKALRARGYGEDDRHNPTTIHGTPGQPAGDTEAAGRSLRATSAAEITMRASRWLWEEPTPSTFRAPSGHDSAQWLPLGALCLLGGREGTGKSTWAYRVAAKLTTGTLPGSFFGQPKAVVIVATEDSWAHTIKPRLAAADAGMDRVYRVDAVEDGFETGLTLPADVVGLQKLCQQRDVAMILLDPLMGTISDRLDSHKDHEVRRALEPLSRLAHDGELTILGLIHVNKSTGADLLTRLMASRAFSAVARSVLMTSKEEPEGDPEDPRESFIFGQAKNNLAARIPYTVRYHIEGAEVGHDDELDLPIWSSKVVIDGVVTGAIDELVRAQETRSPTRETTADKAETWLRNYLTGKDPVPSALVKAAAKQEGFSARTIQRAREDLEVSVLTIDGTNKTSWALDDPPENLGTIGTLDTVGTLGTVGTLTDTAKNRDNPMSGMSVRANSVNATVPPRGWHQETKRTGDETCEHGLLLTACGPCWFQRGGRP